MQTLKYNSRGTNVELLQLALTRAGLFNDDIDGIFGKKTLESVKDFQTANGLKADGIVGDKTWAKLMPYINGYTTIKIGKGDTFWSLANKYGTSVKAISTANPDTEPLNLKIGEELTIPFGFSLVPTSINYSYFLLQNILEGLAKRYPFITLFSIGKSVMGKNIYALKIGRGSTEIFYNASFHANEWITTPVLLNFAEQYLNAYATGGKINGLSAFALYNMATLYIVPMVNPDGVDLVNGVMENSQYYIRAKRYASKYPSIPFPSGWKANINGTDLNLQFPAEWEQAKRIKYQQGFTSPAPRDFVGFSPLSESESQAIYNFTLNHSFALILAYHTQGEIIYWKFLDYQPPRSYEIALIMQKSSGYSLEETPYNSAFAGYKDWFIQQYNLPGYTIECGLGENPLPVSQFDKIYKDNLPILTTGITQAI